MNPKQSIINFKDKTKIPVRPQKILK